MARKFTKIIKREKAIIYHNKTVLLLAVIKVNKILKNSSTELFDSICIIT